jgi:hypothetical protein
MSLFKIPTSKTLKVESPALLFRDLKRDPNIKFLWGHQEKTLDSYFDNHLESKDLAIELPTGTGKTLVGLLIGEYRRRSRNERVVFLCSTKQLCAQVHKQAQKYGIPTSLLVGKQADYDAGGVFNYQQAKAIAVTTYSGLFNINPKINDPHVIICDDAHAAENFVPDMWTLSVSRYEHPKLFDRLFSLLKGIMSENAAYRIETDANPNNSTVELISPIALEDVRDAFADAVNSFVTEYGDIAYSWHRIERHFSACNLYCSGHAFELRPILAPTLTHAPFAEARQRIYMSATLGDDGDLERCFGVKTITRLPAPEGWDKRGTGRRLILFPALSPKIDKDGMEVLEGLLTIAKRTLILVPNNKLRDAFKEALNATVTVYVGADTEENLERFRTDQGPAALILANRYDGIDFPGDECRNAVVYGLPLGAGLQETFLTQRLNAFSIIQDRVRTRVTQAMGRCTRDESDYSIILVLGSDLVKWFCTRENIAGMHPELQAEVAFGLENSTESDTQRFLALANAFLTRSDDWDDAEDYIKAERNKLAKAPDATAATLQKAAELEIDYIYALWNGNYEQAYQLADRVLALLSGGTALRAYRCFWQHQAAITANLAWKHTQNDAFRASVADRLKQAANGSYGISWLGALAAKIGRETPSVKQAFAIDEWFNVIEELLADLGLRGPKFDRTIATKREFIAGTEANKFHQGLEFLGKMVGAITHQWSGNGKPDGFWNLVFWRSFVFEAKTDETPNAPISLTTVRQALTHQRCVYDDRLLPPHTQLHTVVISPRSTIDDEARRHASDLLYCSHSHIIELFDRAAAALTEVRTIAVESSPEELRDKALQIYIRHRVMPDTVASMLSAVTLATMQTPSEIRAKP